MNSQVGVLLDEVPDAARERLASDLLARPSAFWAARARRQVSTALYRLTYRNFYGENQGQLPLPPVERWQITVQPATRANIDGHDLVLASYSFASTLLTPTDEPARADARLASVAGVVDEAFVLPADPEQLFERTGYACMNETDFPPGSVDTENAPAFYDDACAAGMVTNGCHLTPPIPTLSCQEAVQAAIGGVDATFHFERIAWNAALADAARVGVARAGGAQLQAVQAGVEDNRIVYRYFPAGSCAIAEGCVGAPGWRRLLQFTATMQNTGDTDAALGDVGPDSAIVAQHMVSFSECHQHMHFNHYGDFSFGGDQGLGSKRAFCLESTARYFNNETTPLVHPYSCQLQGTARGWGDDYIAGLDCQWIDITPVDATGGLTAALRFQVNPDGFLCEGAQKQGSDGQPLFEPTSFTNEAGETESRFQCDAFPDAAADNVVTTDVTVPDHAGGMVTQPCRRFQVGPKRNCGFGGAGAPIACTQGQEARLRCTGGLSGVPIALRLCEVSAALGAIPCTFNDALGSAILAGAAQEVPFRCPEPRSVDEPGGLVHMYLAPLVDGDSVSGVSCTLAP